MSEKEDEEKSNLYHLDTKFIHNSVRPIKEFKDNVQRLIQLDKVGFLEDVLKHVGDEDIIGVLTITLHRNGNYGSGWSTGVIPKNLTQVLGAIERLKIDLIDNC